MKNRDLRLSISPPPPSLSLFISRPDITYRRAGFSPTRLPLSAPVYSFASRVHLALPPISPLLLSVVLHHVSLFLHIVLTLCASRFFPHCPRKWPAAGRRARTSCLIRRLIATRLTREWQRLWSSFRYLIVARFAKFRRVAEIVAAVISR